MPNIHDQRNKQGQGKWLQCTIVSQFMRISLEQTILPNGLTISHLLKKKYYMIWWYQNIFGRKGLTWKIDEIHKDWELYLYQDFTHSFRCKKSRYSRYIHCLQNKSTSFSLRYWNILVSRYQNHFVHKIST